MTLIDDLVERGLLSYFKHGPGVVSYCFAGPLYEAYEALDRALVAVGQGDLEVISHSSSTVIPRYVLERIGYFEKLPSVPFEAVPHAAAQVGGRDQGEWLLTPSTCYGTFAHLENRADIAGLSAFTARTTCHRAESSAVADWTRLWGFDMREIVVIGEPERVTQECDAVFRRMCRMIASLGADVTVEAASDLFSGPHAELTRDYQLALGLKLEARLPGSNGQSVAVGSRNLHQGLFAQAFNIGSDPANLASGCVGFGLDRLLLTLLAGVADGEPELLSARIASAGTRSAHGL